VQHDRQPQTRDPPGSRFGLIADTHIHPGKSPPLPEKLNDVFRGCDAILVLGDLGEASGLDTLQRIAPVLGVTGADDAFGDPRLRELRLFDCKGLKIAALFDGVKHALFESCDPFLPFSDVGARAAGAFGVKPDILLCASTHKPLIASAAGIFVVNPGSPTLSDTPTVVLLDVGDGHASAGQIAI
jgi:putative phosphoesterase